MTEKGERERERGKGRMGREGEGKGGERGMKGGTEGNEE